MKSRNSMLLVVLIGVSAASQAMSNQIPIEFRLGTSESSDGLTEYRIPGSDDMVYLHDEVLLHNAHIDSVSVVEGWNGYHIILTFTDEGSELFSEITGGNIGAYLAIFVGDELLIAAVIQEEISGPTRISGEYTLDEATRIANGIMGIAD